MKKIFFVLAVALTMNIANSQTIKVITYNLRYENPNDGENNWILRRDFLAEMIKFHEPDIFDIQEGLASQVDFLDSALNYKHVGVGRDDGNREGEFSAIFYNSDKFKLIKSSTFWLSETPDIVSKGWDAVCNRICTYALFMNESTKQYFWVFNTHFDHAGEIARTNSAKLILTKINSLNTDNYPFILTGDFNLEPESEPIKYLSNQLIESKSAGARVVFGPSGTFNNFEFNKPVTRRIDYVFISKSGLKVDKYAVLSHSNNCRYPSDHLPVYVELSFTAK